MPVEEIVEEIRRQERIINEAQRVKDGLYDSLLAAGSGGFELISVKEAARLLGVSVGTVYNKINSGELRARHVSSAIRLLRTDVMAVDDRTAEKI